MAWMALTLATAWEGISSADEAVSLIGRVARVYRVWTTGESSNATRAFLAAGAEADRILTEETSRACAVEMPYLRARIENLEGRIKAELQEPQFVRLLENFGREAAQEATDERIRLLAHAGAGAFDLRMHIAERARAERTLRELDPGDVLALHAIDRCATYIYYGHRFTNEAELRYAFWSKLDNADTLAASGCVRDAPNSPVAQGMAAPANHQLHVTPLGRLILQITRSYAATRTLPFDIPGRDLFPGSRSPAEAWDVIHAVDGLHDAVVRLSSGKPTRYDAARLDYNSFGPPHPRGAGVLRIDEVERDAAERLASKAPRDETRPAPTPNTPTDRIEVEVHSVADRATVDLVVRGPHDVLRWLADEIEARWI
jgi:hypothetical protein